MTPSSKNTPSTNPLKQKRVLGRGLSALLSDNTKEALPKAIGLIPLNAITVNQQQPRIHFDSAALDELAQSIKVHGIIQPLTVRETSPNQYQLISGQRRYEAAKKLGVNAVPAFVRKANDHEMLEMALIENIQRENLNALEIACTYQRLIQEFGLKQEEMARRVGKNRSTITNYLRLLRLPDSIQATLRDETISVGHAMSLLAIEHVDEQLALLKEILKNKLSVRETEARVSSLLDKRKQAPKTSQKTSHNQLEQQLSERLATKVSVQTNRKGKGEIRIAFYSTDDLNRLMDELCNPT